MSYTIIHTKSRQEWLEHRKGGIGSSEVGTILGLNPFETPYQLWRRKKGLDAPKEENFAMRAGHYLEDAVSRFYSDATGKEIIRSSAEDFLVVDDERDFLRVSPDRTFWIPGRARSPRNQGILECKTTQMSVDEDDVPKHWYCQLQYQLGVAEREEGALAWLVSGREFGYKDITFDKDFYDWMTGEVERFWTDCILGGAEPPAVNVEDVLLRSPRHEEGRYVEADEELLAACSDLKDVNGRIKGLNETKKELEETLKMAIGEGEALFDPGSGNVLATWKASKDSVRFDEKRFASERPDLYADYRKTVPGSRRFLLK